MAVGFHPFPQDRNRGAAGGSSKSWTPLQTLTSPAEFGTAAQERLEAKPGRSGSSPTEAVDFIGKDWKIVI